MFKQLIQHHRILLLFGVIILGLSIAPRPAHAELRRVEQAILGMDCAPCAYGMQQGLGALEGVTDVAVSLNEMRATLELKPGNELTLNAIREVIVNGGFKPTQATVSVVGTLRRQEEQLVLTAGKQLAFALIPADPAGQAWARLREWPAGEAVLIEGQVGQENLLSVLTVSPAPQPIEAQKAR